MKTNTSQRIRKIAAGIAAASLLASSAFAEDAYWSLNGTGNFTTAANWSLNADGTGGAPGISPNATQTATFTSSNNNNNVAAILTAGTSVGGLVFSNTGTTTFYTDNVANRALTIGSGGMTVNSDAGVITFGNTTTNQRVTFTLGASQTWTNNSSNLLTLINNNSINAASGRILTIAGTGDTYLDGAITNTGGVTMSGSGNLTLGAANSFTGGLILNTGTLVLDNALAVGNGTVTINGGSVNVLSSAITTTNANTYNWNGNFTYGGNNTWNTGNGAVTMNASRTITVAGSTMSVAGAIGDGGNNYSLTIAGAGALNIAANATYGGGTVVSTGGTLRVGNSTGATITAGTGNVTLQEGSRITGMTNTGTTNTLANNVIVAGNFTTGQTGFLGALNLSGNVSLGSQDRVITVENSTSNGNLAAVLSGVVSGSGGIVKEGTGFLTLDGTSNDFTGNITVNNGTLVVRSQNSLGSSSKTIFMNGGTLSTVGVQSLSAANPVAVGGNFTLASASNPLTLSGPVDLGSVDRTITSAGIGNKNISGNITGNAGLIVADSFAANATATSMILTGNNSFTGNLTLGATVFLSVNRTEALGAGAKITINQNARLMTTANMTVTKDFEFAGSTQGFIPSAGTTLTLNSANFTATDVGGMAPRLTDSGTLVLAGANTWADDMRFDVITGATGLGLGNAAALNGAGLKYNNGGAQLDNTSGADMALTGFKGLILTTGFTFVGTNSLDLSGGNQTGFTQTAGSSRTITVQNNTLTLAGLRAIGNYTMGGGADSVDGSLVKAGNGTLVIAGASEYTLGTTVSAGKLVAGHSNALGTGEMELSNTGATLELANGVNIGNELFFRNTGGAKTLQLSSTATSAAYSGNITLLDTNAGDSRVSVGLGQTLTVTGNIFSSSLTTQGVSKLGDGTLVLSGNDNLGADNAIGGSGANADKKIQGVIAVDAGTLRVNGNMGNATGTINVASGATLGGNGTFAGSVNVDGTLAAGNSIGVLNTGALSMNATSVLDVELGRDTGTPVSDRTNVTGSVSIASGADLELTLYTGLTAPVLGDIFYLISNDGADAISGVFTSLEGTPTTLSEGSTFSWNSLSWTITYLADFEGSAFTGGNDLAIKVIPEPTTLAMLLGGVGMLALLRRRRS